MATYRVGVIGHTGKGNYGHGIDSVWLEVENCEIVAVADAEPKGLAEAVKRLTAPKGYDDYQKMLDEAKPDIVAIGPRWLDQHRDMAVAAAERGMHIYMEKPFCRTPAEADQIVAACEKNDVKLAIAHQTRYSPKLQTIRELIEDGQIGRVLELRGRGKEDARGGGEDLWVLGSHIMNLMHHFGSEPRWCFASVLADGEPITPEDVKPGNEGISPLAGDTVNAMYGMDDGVTAYFGSHRGAGAGGSRFGLQICGSAGVIEILTGYLPPAYYLPDPMWSPGRSGKRWLPISSAGIDQPEPLGGNSLHAGNVAAVRDLLAAIEEDRYPECSALEGRTTVEMISAVFHSHRQGGPVEFPLKNRDNALADWGK
ncbi:MAG: Gfo/Idh/MocA family oxidoreductase [Planctomycetes bacterium]|nr:Gfo/Idh/MocA family oxidoreductase [Planctomycetota bacterium]